MSIRISDHGDRQTQNPPPGHDADGAGHASKTAVTSVDPLTAAANAPAVLRGVMVCREFLVAQDFGFAPSPAGSQTETLPPSGGAAEGTQVAAGMAAAESTSMAAAPQSTSLDNAGIPWKLRDTGGKYNVGTPEDPEMRKVAPRWVPGGGGGTQTGVQRIVREVKVHASGPKPASS